MCLEPIQTTDFPPNSSLQRHFSGLSHQVRLFASAAGANNPSYFHLSDTQLIEMAFTPGGRGGRGGGGGRGGFTPRGGRGGGRGGAPGGRGSSIEAIV